jgi:succinyl-diaminopimelate desuccinylase
MSDPSPDPVAYLKALIACRSITPADGGALGFLGHVLEGAGFSVVRKTFSEPGTPDVDNLFATIGSGAPHLVFGGHTDVVPPGDEAGWRHPPFSGAIEAGTLYGRGAVDMKGGIACFLAAALGHLRDNGLSRGTLSFLITGDEEGPSLNGTVKLLAFARAAGHRFDAAIVGEPTSRTRVGDMVKIGRRGSLSGVIRVAGRQGHVAYPHLADNPVPHLVRILHRLSDLRLDEGSPEFQPSNLEVVSVDVGNPAFNVIPAEASARFNVRFNDQWSAESLAAFIKRELVVASEGADFRLTVMPGASEPFLTRSEALIGGLAAAIVAETGEAPELSTTGGTSDARFFKDACPVVEFGLVGDTMHQVDERVPLADLAALTAIYRRFIAGYFSGAAADA